MQLQAKYLSGHHCVERKVLVSTTVVRGHMSSFILSNKFSRGLMNIAWMSRFIHKVICRVVGRGTAVTYLGIK